MRCLAARHDVPAMRTAMRALAQCLGNDLPTRCAALRRFELARVAQRRRERSRPSACRHPPAAARVRALPRTLRASTRSLCSGIAPITWAAWAAQRWTPCAPTSTHKARPSMRARKTGNRPLDPQLAFGLARGMRGHVFRTGRAEAATPSPTDRALRLKCRHLCE